MRKYAELCRTSHQTVSAAIKNGLIRDGWDAKERKIIKSIADVEWGTKFMQNRAIEKAQLAGYEYDSEDEAEITGEFDETTNRDELERIELYYKVRERKLKIEKEEGTLVNKQQVYAQLFEFGRNLRTRIKALPDTIIDQVITMTRDEAKLFLDEKLHEILEEFSNDTEKFIDSGTDRRVAS